MIIDVILNLLFPKRCVGCGVSGDYLCGKCMEKLEFVKKQSCPNCRRANESGCFCHEKCRRGYHFDRLLVCMNYTKDSMLKKLLVLFKYKFSRELSGVLGGVMVRQFSCFSHIFRGALLVPVPLHKKRRRDRGFNQAGLLAEHLSKKFSHQEICECLFRNSYTGAQARLLKNERLLNVRNTISVEPSCRRLLKGRTVILIDDVATTCSTLNECSRALKECGVRHVCGLVLARGWLFQSLL